MIHPALPDLILVDKLNRSGEVSLLMDTHNKRVLIGRTVSPEAEPVYRRLIGTDHPNLVSILDLYPNEDGTFLALEAYLDGQTLAKALLRKRTLPHHEAIRILTQLCDACTALHRRGIVHRAVTLENVMLLTNRNPVLFHFNQAKGVTVPTGETPNESTEPQLDITPDLIALGVMYNQLLTGTHPSDHLVSGPRQEIVSRCLNTDPDKRFTSVAELKSALLNASGDTGADHNRFRNFDWKSLRPRKITPQSVLAFIRRIPGFRTGNFGKMIVAVFGYYAIYILAYSFLSTALDSAMDFFIGIVLTSGMLYQFAFIVDFENLRTNNKYLQQYRHTPSYWKHALVYFMLINTVIFIAAFLGVALSDLPIFDSW